VRGVSEGGGWVGEGGKGGVGGVGLGEGGEGGGRFWGRSDWGR
jgi:hypothetical protein